MSGVKKDIMWRLYLAFSLIILFAIAIIIQVGKIQFVQGETYRAKADSVNVKYQTITARRGSIYADGGDLLAASFPFYTIAIDPNACAKKEFYNKIDSLSLQLSNLFADKSKSEYKQKLIEARKQGKRYFIIQNRATVPQMEAVKAFPILRKGRYGGGLIIEPEDRRINPYGSLAYRTVGYINNDIKVGLEASFDSELAGTSGKRLVQKISGGTWMPVNDDNAIEPKDGVDISTTLDVNMQDIAEAALRRSLVNNNAAYGSAVVMEVKTGKIKAISNLTRISPGNYEERMNYAIADRSDPGSVFKLVSLLALFEDGFAGINDSVDLHNGSIQYYNRTMWDSEGRHNLRNVTVQQAFEKSSNVGISSLVNKYYKNNPEKYLKHITDIGLQQPTGIEIPGEAAPYIKLNPKDKNNWSGVTLPWMSVGYEVELTPLQILTFYNAVANNGKMMKPYLVEKTQSYGKTIEEFKPAVLKEKICSDKTLEQLKICMEGVVLRGTAKTLKNEYYSIAGKTGTAQIADKNLGYSHVYKATFVGYFPADNPKYSCIVVVNAPSNGVFYGAYVAGPVFREIADKIYSHHTGMMTPVNEADSLYKGVTAYGKGYRNDYDKIFKWLKIDDKIMNVNDEWISVLPQNDSLQTQPLSVSDNVMPSVKGMGMRDALYLLENKGLNVNPVGKGKVIYQSVEPGNAIKKGMYVTIKLG